MPDWIEHQISSKYVRSISVEYTKHSNISVNSGLYSLLNNKQISKISKHLFHGYLATSAGDL